MKVSRTLESPLETHCLVGGEACCGMVLRRLLVAVRLSSPLKAACRGLKLQSGATKLSNKQAAV